MGIPINKVEYYRMRYPTGTKLKLTSPIEDPYSPKKIGDIMVVDYIDDMAQIHGNWSSGGNIAIIIEQDNFEIVND